MTNWYSVDTTDDQARLLAAWTDAPVENSELAGMLLDVAKEQVLAFAPEPDDDADPDAPPPARYVYAQLQQAQNLWNAGRSSQDGDVGGDGYSFTPRPLDKTIRALIRPTSGAADVF
jgi:hypothetical protein